MKVRLSISNLKNIVFFLVLFFMGMNFQGKFYYFAFLILIIIILMQFRGLCVPYEAFWYAMLGIVMGCYNFLRGEFSIFWCLMPVVMYLVGYNFAINEKKEHKNRQALIQQTETVGYMLLEAVSLGAFTHYMLNCILNGVSTIGRNTIDIWSGEIMAATRQGALASLMLGLAIAMLFFPLKKGHRILGCLYIAGILYYNFILAGRTLIFSLVIIFILAFWYANRLLKKQKKRKMELWKIVVLGSLFLAIIFLFTINKIEPILTNSNFFSRFTDLNSFFETSGRNEAKMNYIENAIQFPFGGLHLRNRYGYAHDLLLDAYDEYGIIVFILLLIILILGIRHLYIFVKKTPFSNEYKLAQLCVMLSIMLYFCIEPILAGVSWLFFCYCLFNGYVARISKFQFTSYGEYKRNESITD